MLIRCFEYLSRGTAKLYFIFITSATKEGVTGECPKTSLLMACFIDESQLDSTVAKPGATVTILDLSEADAQEETFTIVGTFETDPLNGKISNESPLAKAILDHGVNEIVSVGVAEPYEVKILKIEYMA